MSKSPNIGLTLTPYSESSKKFIDFRTELAGDGEDSNMMIIDSEIGILKTQAETISGTPFTWGMLKGGFSSPVTSEEDV